MSGRVSDNPVPSDVHCASPSETAMAVDVTLFYRGLLFALRELRGQFIAEGAQFHTAFRGMLEAASRERPFASAAQRMLENFDPVFGVSPEATEMLLEGERDFIVTLENPRLRIARFKLGEDEAKHELDELPSAELFRKLAGHLHDQLGA